jgi:ribose transport system ATP-binding protein
VNEAVLRVEGLSKRFGATQALDGVGMALRAHEVLGLVGENGAGKSTLINVLAGLCPPDQGSIVVRGKPVRLRNERDAAEAGIGRVGQEPAVLLNLSVAENILLGHEDAALRGVFYDWRALHALAAAQLAKLGAAILPSAPTDTLSFAERQMVELAKVLAIEERTPHEPVILLDEPTSMLDAGQIDAVLALIERLRGRASVVFVSHRLDEVLRVCDRICVMRDGRVVAQRDRAGCSVAELRQLMLGHEPAAEHGRPPAPGAAPVPAHTPTSCLTVRALSRARSYQAVSFELSAGHVLGIAGSEGSGRESLCRTLFGAEAPDSGEIVLDGHSVRLAEPADAVQLGIGYVPAERRAEGIVAGMSVSENMTLAQLGGLRRGPVIDFARERGLVKTWIERLRIRPDTPHMPAQHLSGGNQQKVVLAKWMVARKPRLLILDRPLRGLDVGARAEMIPLIRELAAGGIAIVLVADTLDELLALSDDILVMKDGTVSARFPASAAKPSELQILERMV